MAEIKCEKCGKEFSDTEQKCPHCAQMIKNYAQFGKTAILSSEYDNANNYADKILELDPNNAEGWFLKGAAIPMGKPGWIPAMINCYKNGLEAKDGNTPLNRYNAVRVFVSIVGNLEVAIPGNMLQPKEKEDSIVILKQIAAYAIPLFEKYSLQDEIRAACICNAMFLDTEEEVINAIQRSKKEKGPFNKDSYEHIIDVLNYYKEDKYLNNNRPQRQGGCYIATAVYKSYDCPEVWVLRRFRDFSLKKNFFGSLFISLYYKISPTLVKIFGKNTYFIRFWKIILDNLVQSLQKKGFKNTPYKD